MLVRALYSYRKLLFRLANDSHASEKSTQPVENGIAYPYLKPCGPTDRSSSSLFVSLQENDTTTSRLVS